MAGDPLIWWEHFDERGMSRAFAEACARARAQAWDSDSAPGLSTGTRAADLRVLSLASMWAAERMSRGGPARGATPQVNDIPTDPSGYATAERGQAALRLLRTWAILMPADTDGPTAIRTSGGNAAEPLADAGLLPAVAVIAVIVKWTAVTVGAYLVAREAASVIDRQLSRSEKTKRLVAGQASATEIAVAHADREAKAGQELPLSEAERVVLEQLGTVQDAALKPEEPLHSNDSSPWSSLLIPALVVLGVVFLTAKE